MVAERSGSILDRFLAGCLPVERRGNCGDFHWSVIEVSVFAFRVYEERRDETTKLAQVASSAEGRGWSPSAIGRAGVVV